MRRVDGDIFTCEPKEAWIVISTNVGWSRNGSNVMGAGLAHEAALRVPTLPVDYGAWCQAHGGKIYVSRKHRLICLPSKPLNENQPWASWRGKACPSLIRESYRQLLTWAVENPNEKVKLAPFGGMCGKIPMDEAIALVDEVGFPDNVFLVLR